MNISGILVQTKPGFVEDLVLKIKQSGFCEYHLHDEKGRIIVTIEGETTEQELEKLNLLKRLDHVIAADMMYAYSEDELSELRSDLEKSKPVVDWLNDPNVDASQIKYNGDLKKRY